MSLGRISGPLLKENLLRDGVNLQFENDLLYLRVKDAPSTHRIGIKTTNPREDHVLDVNGKAFFNEIDTDKLQADFILLDENLIKSTTGDLVLQAGTASVGDSGDKILIKNNVKVEGNLHATGAITSDGSITLGDTDADNIVFVADINSNIIPNTTKLYDIGTNGALVDGKSWRRVYVDNMRLGDPLKTDDQYFNLSATGIPGSGSKADKTYNAINTPANYVEITNLNTNGHLALSTNGIGLIECFNTTRLHQDLNVIGDIATDNANYILLGDPELGILDGAVEMTNETSLTDGVAQLNLTLTLLVPLAPPDFPNNQNLQVTNFDASSTAQFRIIRQAFNDQPLNNNTITGNRSPGDIVFVIRQSGFKTSTISNSGPGNRGNLKLIFNNQNIITKTLTSGNSTQVIISTFTKVSKGSPLVGYIQPKIGVLIKGHLITISDQGSTFGGLGNPGTCYYINNVTSKTLELKLYNKNTGTIGGFFSPPDNLFSDTTTIEGSVKFTTVDDTGLFANANDSIRMQINNNIAYPLDTPGFHETLDVVVTSTYGTNAALPGWNTVQLEHTGIEVSSGIFQKTPIGGTDTNIGIWYYDSTEPQAPVFSNLQFTLKTSSITYSSTIPHYDNDTVYQLSFDLNWNPGLTNHSSLTDNILTTAATGPWTSSGNKNYNNLGYTYLPDASLSVTNSDNFTVKIKSDFGAETTITTVPIIRASNSYLFADSAFPPLNKIILYKTGIASSTTRIDEMNIHVVNSIGTLLSDLADDGKVQRCINPDGGVANQDTPVFTAGSALFDSEDSVLFYTDATLVGTGNNVASIKHDKTNYNIGHLPLGGPNLNISERSGPQYFTFRFRRLAVSNFKIFYTSAGTLGIGGIWCAMPGEGGTESTLNKWLDASISADMPNGCATGGLLDKTKTGPNNVTISFNNRNSTNATNNEIWVRIKLNSGQSITSLYLGA